MRILLTGKDGLLGRELHRRLRHTHDVIALGRLEIDLLQRTVLMSCLRLLPRIDLTIHCAAWTAIDLAEEEPKLAETVNADATEIIAQEMLRRHVPMIYFSTDYVFDGINRTVPYDETNVPNPISVYGRTKLEGELRVSELLEKHLIFRTSGLFGLYCPNFFLTMLNCFNDEIVPQVSCDRIVTPNCVTVMADAVAQVTDRIAGSSRSVPWGLYHLSGSGETSWYEFSKKIYDFFAPRWNMTSGAPVPCDTMSDDSIRPEYSALNADRFMRTFELEIPPWEVQFRCFLQEYF